MTRFLILTAALAALATAAPAQSMLEACEADIAKYCGAVEPGHGRISACLYAHEDKVSDGCDAATAEIGDVMDMFFSRVREIGIACGEDVQKHCADVSVGGGLMIGCLRKAEISAACGAAIEGIGQSDG